MAQHLVKSTADLTPAGVAGYAKSVAAFLSGLIAVILQFVTDGDLRSWLTGAVAVLGFIAVYSLPNAVETVKVVDADPDGTVYNK